MASGGVTDTSSATIDEAMLRQIMEDLDADDEYMPEKEFELPDMGHSVATQTEQGYQAKPEEPVVPTPPRPPRRGTERPPDVSATDWCRHSRQWRKRQVERYHREMGFKREEEAMLSQEARASMAHAEPVFRLGLHKVQDCSFGQLVNVSAPSHLWRATIRASTRKSQQRWRMSQSRPNDGEAHTQGTCPERIMSLCTRGSG